mmetsp:Transcript_53638/g.85290  ORF Transcript_53638/g.85290 Transcript_53638/m.85290 type:complete len:138 (-) Transcript_53638:144-557(-)
MSTTLQNLTKTKEYFDRNFAFIVCSRLLASIPALIFQILVILHNITARQQVVEEKKVLVESLTFVPSDSLQHELLQESEADYYDGTIETKTQLGLEAHLQQDLKEDIYGFMQEDLEDELSNLMQDDLLALCSETEFS